MWNSFRALLLPCVSLFGVVATLAMRPTAVGATPTALQILDRLPLTFLENRGQAGSGTDFYAIGKVTSVAFSERGVSYTLNAEQPSSTEVSDSSVRHVIRQEFVGGAHVEPVGARETEAQTSFFRGKRSEWKTALRSFETVRYSGLWPGIDAEYSGAQDQLKSEFLVAAGADPGLIRLAYKGTTSLEVDPTGRLAITTPIRTLYDDRPVAFQIVGERKVHVPCSYKLLGDGHYTFAVGGYDSTRPLVIDPTILVQCGFIGGSNIDFATGAAVDAQGNLYVVGTTESAEASFPTRVGPVVTYSGSSDAFVAKIPSEGESLEYCGYIGGTGIDEATGIAIDALGNAYVTGETSSTENQGFPVQGAFDSTHNGATDAYVAKVTPDGSALAYCGFLGGTSIDSGGGVGVDGAGNVYVSGFTSSSELQGFPVISGPDLTFNGASGGTQPAPSDGFVAKIDAAGGALLYCGYIGGALVDSCSDLAVSPAGVCTVVGATRSSQDTFPVVGGPDLTANGGSDGFAARVNTSGRLIFSGFVGGAEDDQINAVAIDTNGNTYLGGDTSSPQSSFPEVVGPDLTFNGSRDGFIAKVQSNGTTLTYCGYVGGSLNESVLGVAVDTDGSLFCVGETLSASANGFPVVDGPDLTFNGGNDAFVVRINPGGNNILLSTYIGSSRADRATDVALDPAGAAYVVGTTIGSSDDGFPVRERPDLTFNGFADAFAAKLLSSPRAPTGATVVAISPTRARLSWTDRSRNEDEFEVFRRTGDGALELLGEVERDRTDALDESVEEGGRFTYQVRAINAAGASALSNAATVVIPLVPPTELVAAIVSPMQVRLRWTDNSRNETGYVIERRTGAGSFSQVGTTSSGANEAPASPPVVEFVDTTAVAGIIYDYQVRANGAFGLSDPSNLVTVNMIAPLPPAGMSATALGNSVHIDWSDTNNTEAGYRVERRTASTAFVRIAETGANATTLVDQGVALETEFTYRVVAFNGIGPSTNNPRDTAFTLASPGNLRANQVDGIVSLVWDDNSSLETKYLITRDNTILGNVAANTTTFVLGPPNAIVEARHTATATRGSDSSAVSEVNVEPLRPPIALTLVSVSRTAVDLRFQDPNTIAHQVRVERRIGAGAFATLATLPVGVLTFRDIKITPGKLHTYRVRAISGIGESAASNQVEAGPLAIPTGFTANAVSSVRVDLRWDDTNEVETSYEVSRRLDGQTAFSVVANTVANARTASDSFFPPNRTIDYRVSAVRDGVKQSSVISSVRVLASPTSFDLRSIDGIVEAVWTNRTTLEDGIQLEIENSSGIFVVHSRVGRGVNRVTIADVSPDTTLKARVRAFATRSLSDPSNTDTVTTPAAPAAMTGVAEDSTHVRLAWTDRSKIEDSQEVQVRDVLSSGFGGWRALARVGANTEEYVVEATAERRLQYRVRAGVGVDASAWCPEWPIVTTLAAPKKLRVSRAGVLFSLQWQDLSRFENGYAIEARPQGGKWREVARTTANAESFRGNGLRPGKRYRFRIRAVGATGFSSFSNIDHAFE